MITQTPLGGGKAEDKKSLPTEGIKGNHVQILSRVSQQSSHV